jgi:hypothetical protein
VASPISCIEGDTIAVDFQEKGAETTLQGRINVLEKPLKVDLQSKGSRSPVAKDLR